MKIKMLVILKYLACFANFLSFFPLVVFFNSMFSSTYSSSDCLLQLLFIVACGFAGYLFSFLLEDKRRKSTVQINTIFIITCMLPIGISIVLMLHKGIVLCVLMSILSVISYIIGNSLYYKSYSQIMSKAKFGTAIIMNTATIFILWLAKYPYSMGLFTGVFLCILIIYGIIINQSNIDFLMERRHHKFENLPKNIRIFNIKLLVVVLFIILVCFFMRGWLVASIYWILGASVDIIKIIIYGIFMLINLLSQKTTNSQNIKMKSLYDLPHKVNNRSDKWLIILIVIIFIWIIIKNRKRILQFLIDSVHKFGEAIKALLKKSHILIKPNYSNEYYYDDEEYIKPEEIKKQNSQRAYLKQWSKSCKSFYKMTDTSEKFRLGYRLVVDGLKLSGLAISQSDTTMVILDKSREIIKTGSYTLATEDYNSIRYGNYNFELTTMENLYTTLQIVGNEIGIK